MVMQSEEDVERACELGASREKVRFCGNLKYDVPEVSAVGTTRAVCDVETSAEDANRPDQPNLGIDLRQLIVAGSTAPGEEEILLASLGAVRQQAGLEGTRMLLAPRHPERFDEVARLIARSGFSFCRRSELGEAWVSAESEGDRSLLFRPGEAPDVILLDTIGELAKLYRYASVVFVGGSLTPRGGHNILEPAAFAKPIIVGSHTENFKQIVREFLRAGAVVQIGGSGEDAVNGLTYEIIRLLSNPYLARAIGEQAKEFLRRNRGATECTIEMIKQMSF
jgi:3-deoxy-D-manno-octulosonic-acid transferase